jgi:hypothetical protein
MPQILDGPLWRSFATPATASYVCSALRPVIPDAIVLRHVWPELAVSGGSRCAPEAAAGQIGLALEMAAYKRSRELTIGHNRS